MLAKLINLSLLGLFPFAWQAPLARTEVKWLFISDEISIFSGVVQLYERDPFLAIIIGLFAIVTPYFKTVALLYAQFSDNESAARILPIIEVLGRLSMVDVFLIALFVLVYRGIGSIEVAWGFYFFTGLVLASIFASYMTFRARFRTVLKPDAGAETAGKE